MPTYVKNLDEINDYQKLVISKKKIQQPLKLKPSNVLTKNTGAIEMNPYY